MPSSFFIPQGSKASLQWYRTMKTVKLTAMNYQLLTELAKKNRKNIESYLGDLIQNAYMEKK